MLTLREQLVLILGLAWGMDGIAYPVGCKLEAGQLLANLADVKVLKSLWMDAVHTAVPASALWLMPTVLQIADRLWEESRG